MRSLLCACPIVIAIGGCASSGPFDPGATESWARVVARIEQGVVTQLKGVSSNQRTALLAPSLGARSAPVATALEALFTGTSLGKTLGVTQSIPVFAYVLATDDGRQVTVLDTFPTYSPGTCLKLFESPTRSDYPRIASGTGCKAVAQ